MSRDDKMSNRFQLITEGSTLSLTVTVFSSEYVLLEPSLVYPYQSFYIHEYTNYGKNEIRVDFT